MRHGYQCENCMGFSTLMHWIFKCLWCEEEICDSCMHSFATCKKCAKNRSEQELMERFEEVYG